MDLKVLLSLRRLVMSVPAPASLCLWLFVNFFEVANIRRLD